MGSDKVRLQLIFHDFSNLRFGWLWVELDQVIIRWVKLELNDQNSKIRS